MSERFTIKRRIELDMAHRVPDHASKCFAIHGHRYVVEAIVSGPLYTGGEQKGMVMDFGFLKEVMMKEIHDKHDHGITLLKNDPAIDAITNYGTNMPTWLKLCRMEEVPTAENLAHAWFHRLNFAIAQWLNSRGESSGRIRLDALIVHETPNSVATYYRQELTCNG